MRSLFLTAALAMLATPVAGTPSAGDTLRVDTAADDRVAADTVAIDTAGDAGAPDTVAVELPPPADTFVDAEAEGLLATVRARAARTEREIAAYRVEGRERVSAHARMLGRERLLFRMETAARVSWRRGEPAEVEPLGARMAAPIAENRVRAVPSAVNSLVFDPAVTQEFLRIPWSSERLRHPLAPGAEHHYRYATGEPGDIRLADGRLVRVRELRVQPRRSEFGLVRGSFWIDVDQGAVVRAVMRPARPFRISIDAQMGRTDDGAREAGVTVGSGSGPGRLPFGLDGTADIRTITMEADLWHGRWWLPRLLVAEGSAEAMGVLTVPVRWERVYGVYSIEGSPDDAPLALEPGGDPAEDEPPGCPKRLPEGVTCQCSFNSCTLVRHIAVADTAALIDGPALPRSIFAEGESLLTREEWRSVEEAIRGLPDLVYAPFQFEVVSPWHDISLLRYNRVEGLSAGMRLRARGPDVEAGLSARLGLADPRPSVALTAAREVPAGRIGLRLAHELTDVDPAGRALLPGNSLNALLFGRDDGEYYRRIGASATVAPPTARRQSWEARFFAERQRPVERRTGFSLADWSGDGFRPVVDAARADQLGASLGVRGSYAPFGSLRLGAGATVDGEVGTFRFARASAELDLRGALGARLGWALEGALGSSLGDVPPQRWWFLGGPHTLRGYDGSTLAGDSFARARLEVARGIPAARLAVFGDAGWAGPRADFLSEDPLAAVGVGASFLDGIVRLDVARAIRSPTGWRVDFYLDGAL